MSNGAEDDAIGLRARPPAVKEAWLRTNDDMEAVAEDRRSEGWDVTSMPAVHTSPVGRATGDDDRFGLVHVIPDNHADAFTDAFERGEFPDYQAYRNEIQSHVFLVTELLDPDSETVILIASHYDVQHAAALFNTVHQEGCIYTHAETVDGTELGSVRHDEYEPFVPDDLGAGVREG